MTEVPLNAGYVLAVEAMAKVLQTARAEGSQPLFVFPPKEVMVIAALDEQGTLFCRNDAARALLPTLDFASRSLSNDGATIFMLRCALDFIEMPYETAPLATFGLQTKAFLVRHAPGQA